MTGDVQKEQSLVCGPVRKGDTEAEAKIDVGRDAMHLSARHLKVGHDSCTRTTERTNALGN